MALAAVTSLGDWPQKTQRAQKKIRIVSRKGGKERKGFSTQLFSELGVLGAPDARKYSR
jgi:hypothetical protein